MTRHRLRASIRAAIRAGAISSASAAGLTLALTVAPDPLALARRRRSRCADAPLSRNVWVTIATDGTITIVSPAAEMGQGTFTTLPAVFADELDADWAKVKPVFPPVWDEKKYGNPEYTYDFQTSASFATRGYFKPMRIAGAQARRVLLDAVAAKWGVPVGELSTEPSVVVHKASSRRICYGEIAAFAKAPAELPKIEDKDLKPAASFRYIGKDVPRVEVPLKVTGAAKYAHRRPGARHGLRRGAAVALSGRRAGDGRRRRAPARCPASPTS